MDGSTCHLGFLAFWFVLLAHSYVEIEKVLNEKIEAASSVNEFYLVSGNF